MRRHKAGTLAAAVSLAFAGTAVADIVSTGLQAVEVAPPPSVQNGAYTSPTEIRAFNERQDVVLTAPVAVNITAPGFYDQASDLTPGSIPAGTRVSSHFIHSDPGGPEDFAEYRGSVTFDDPVIGIQVNQGELDGGDPLLGAPGTTYATGELARGYDLFLGEDGDAINLSADRKTVSVLANTFDIEDQIRVITQSPPDTARAGAFICRGTGARLLKTEISVANPPGLPCKKDQKNLVSTGQLIVPGLNLGVKVDVVRADTLMTPPLPSPPAEHDTAFASGEAAHVAIGGLLGMNIRADAVYGQATARCINGTPRIEGHSTVAALSINGREIQVLGDRPIAVPLIIGTLYINKQIRTTTPTGTIQTSRALWLQTILGDVVVGEGIAGVTGNPCVAPARAAE